MSSNPSPAVPPPTPTGVSESKSDPAPPSKISLPRPTAPTAANPASIDLSEYLVEVDMLQRLKVFPPDALPAHSSVNIRPPDFNGAKGFDDLLKSLYDSAKPQNMLSALSMDVRVHVGEVGYYNDRVGKLHLLRPGRHARPPLSRVSRYRVVSLDADEVHLPVDDATLPPSLHVIRVLPGQIVTAFQAGAPLFLPSGRTPDGRPVVGYHVIKNDITFSVCARHREDAPIIECGGDFLLQIPPGVMIKATINGRPLLLGQGHHQVRAAGFALEHPPPADPALNMVNMNDEVISHVNLHVLRVPPTACFLAYLQNQPLIIPPRPEPFVIDDPTFVLAPLHKEAKKAKVIHHSTLLQVQLDAGEVLPVIIDNVPLILGAAGLLGPDAIEKYGIDVEALPDSKGRRYSFCSPNIHVQKLPNGLPAITTLSQSTNILSFRTITMIRVPEGKVGRVFIGSKPVLLQHRAEPYVFNDPETFLDQTPFSATTDPVIIFGTHAWVTVPSGQAARVWNHGHALLLGCDDLKPTRLGGQPDSSVAAPTPVTTADGSGRKYVFQSDNFRLASNATDGYGAFVSLSDKLIRHGSRTVVTIEQGEVGVLRIAGKRTAMQPGVYEFHAPDEFERYLYTGVRTTPAQEILTYDSARLPVTLTFTVTFEISNPQLAAQYTPSDGEGVTAPEGAGVGGDLTQYLLTACHSCLRSSVNATHLLDMGRSADLKGLKDREEEAERTERKSGTEAEGGEMDMLFGGAGGGVDGQGVASDFQAQLHTAFSTQNSALQAQLDRVGVTLIDLSLLDWAVSDEGVVKSIEDLALTAVEAQLDRTKKEATAAAENIKAVGEAKVALTEVDAENQIKLSRARAKLEAARIEAESIVCVAEAEAKAIALKGEAEAKARREALEALGATPAMEWTRQLQEATSKAFSNANLTVAPDNIAGLFAMMNPGSSLFSGMRDQTLGLVPQAPTGPPKKTKPRKVRRDTEESKEDVVTVMSQSAAGPGGV